VSKGQCLSMSRRPMGDAGGAMKKPVPDGAASHAYRDPVASAITRSDEAYAHYAEELDHLPSLVPRT